MTDANNDKTTSTVACFGSTLLDIDRHPSITNDTTAGRQSWWYRDSDSSFIPTILSFSGLPTHYYLLHTATLPFI